MRYIPTDGVRSSKDWLPVVEFEDLYEISRCGQQVYNVKTGRFLKMSPSGHGLYFSVQLWKDGVSSRKFVHVLVAEAFICVRPKGKQVNHRDGDKYNNCVENLEWATCSRNNKHAYDIGLRFGMVGEEHPMARVNENEVRIIRKRHKDGETLQSIADAYGVAMTTIHAITQRRSWANVV